MVKVFVPPAPQGTGKGTNTSQAGVTDETLKSRNEPRQQKMEAKKNFSLGGRRLRRCARLPFLQTPPDKELNLEEPH